jgi:hypothetical protein
MYLCGESNSIFYEALQLYGMYQYFRLLDCNTKDNRFPPLQCMFFYRQNKLKTLFLEFYGDLLCYKNLVMSNQGTDITSMTPHRAFKRSLNGDVLFRFDISNGSECSPHRAFKRSLKITKKLKNIFYEPLFNNYKSLWIYFLVLAR